jgi:hypothetical protein
LLRALPVDVLPPGRAEPVPPEVKLPGRIVVPT